MSSRSISVPSSLDIKEHLNVFPGVVEHCVFVESELELLPININWGSNPPMINPAEPPSIEDIIKTNTYIFVYGNFFIKPITIAYNNTNIPDVITTPRYCEVISLL